MKYDLHTLSQEALEIGRNNDVNGFTKLFADLGNNFRSLLTMFSNDNAEQEESPATTVAASLKNFHDQHATEQYMQVRNLNVYVPPGFKGRFSDYATVLAEAAAVAGTVDEVYLIPTKRFLAELLVNPEKLKAVTLPLQDLNGDRINTVLNKTGAFFKNTMRTDQARLGDVYANFADIDKTADKLILAHQAMNRLSAENAREHAQEITNLVDKLVIRMKQKPEAYGVNAMNVPKVTAMVHTVARAAEFYGTITNELYVATNAYIESMN